MRLVGKSDIEKFEFESENSKRFLVNILGGKLMGMCDFFHFPRSLSGYKGRSFCLLIQTLNLILENKSWSK